MTTPYGPLIVVPDDEPVVLAGTYLEPRLRQMGQVVFYDTRPKDAQGLVERIRDADVVVNIRSSVIFSDQVLQQCPKLKLISVYGVGYDNVDTQAASRLGIAVTNTPGYSAIAVSEMTVGLMLAVAKNLARNDRDVRQDRWARGYGMQLAGKTLGVIGVGDIGRRVVQLGKALGMRVVAWTRNATPERARELGADFVSLEDLLKQSDVVTLHLRLTPETKGFLGRRELELMKPSAILINTARGAIVDEDALIDMLKKGRLAGAGIDVFGTEPLPPGHPFKQLDNVVLSPHVAAMAPETTLKGLEMAVDNVENFLQGRPTHVVNSPQRGRR